VGDGNTVTENGTDLRKATVTYVSDSFMATKVPVPDKSEDNTMKNLYFNSYIIFDYKNQLPVDSMIISFPNIPDVIYARVSNPSPGSTHFEYETRRDTHDNVDNIKVQHPSTGRIKMDLYSRNVLDHLKQKVQVEIDTQTFNFLH
jgi:hypothetical protein